MTPRRSSWIAAALLLAGAGLVACNGIVGADELSVVGPSHDAPSRADPAPKEASTSPLPTAPDAAPSCPGAADCERVVFATSARFSPDEIGGLSGADARCQAAAVASSHARVKGRRFRAWLSDATSSPATRLTHGTKPYVLPSGARVADDWSGLVHGTLTNAIHETEEGVEPDGAVVWTGTNTDGTAGATSCSGWTANTGTAVVGEALLTNASWTARPDPSDCDKSHRFYCIEE